MYTHPDTIDRLATEVRRQYLADAEQWRLVSAVRRVRRPARRNAWWHHPAVR